MKIQYELQRSRRKTLSIFILPNAKVLVKAPMLTSLKTIEKFIIEKSDWILKKQAEAQIKTNRLPAINDGKSITIAGVNYVIKLIDEQKVKVASGLLYLPRSAPKTGLNLFIKRVFLPYITLKTRQIAMRLNFCVKDIKLSSAGKRWGSCSFDNVIRYSTTVALLPEFLCDYIVCHELCHTIQKNHGKEFYKLLKMVMPDYKQREKILKQYSAICSFFKSEE